MSKSQAYPESYDMAGLYEIRIKGHLDSRWSGRFEGLAITLEENGETLLTGPVLDQAALHGLLKKVRDLGMPLVSINSLVSGLADAPGVKSQQAQAARLRELITKKEKK